jgi:hypothetical protein
MRDIASLTRDVSQGNNYDRSEEGKHGRHWDSLVHLIARKKNQLAIKFGTIVK